jgi:hypothetical protein
MAEKTDIRPRRHWRRIHHSPLFWTGFFLLSVAIIIYVLSDGFSLLPRTR